MISQAQRRRSIRALPGYIGAALSSQIGYLPLPSRQALAAVMALCTAAGVVVAAGCGRRVD